MDSLLELAPKDLDTSKFVNPEVQPDQLADALVLGEQSKAAGRYSDTVSFSFEEVYKSLSVTARRIIDRLNDLIQNRFPEGIQQIEPEKITPEKTAEHIVSRATGLFGVFAKQNPELEGEELVNEFMDTIRRGVDKGYDEAFSILEHIGAFEFEGVQESVEQTKGLIEEKLVAFESRLRKQLGLDPIDVEDSVSSQVKNQVIEQVGGNTISIAA